MGRVVSFELNSQDPERASNFYSSVFGWKIAEPNWGYQDVTTGNDDKPGMNGGIAKGPNDYPHGTRIHIEVENIEEAIKKSIECGAQVVREKMEFDHFYLAYLVDPVGNGIGLIQNK
ncbi:VOC family protein [Paenibacillus sp. KN14-4R]|uniref:VOC family protein n=1 Tax=Paenibacillus sp. KN14-4R TaxID=3445773 RepID=UPI003FA0C42B